MTISLIRQRAASVAATMLGAIRHGEWQVDGAADPESAIRRLATALHEQPRRSDAEILRLAAEAAEVGRAAIDRGEWQVRMGHDVSHVLAMAEEAERLAAVAA